MNNMADEINVISEQITSKSCSVEGKEAGKAHHKAKTRVKKTEQDFIFGKVIGEGSFSTVYLAKDKTTGTEFAAKVCMKAHIQKEKKVQNVMREKEIMNCLNENEAIDTPFFVRLAYTFQSERDLYFILSYCQYGEFLQLIKQVGNFDYDSARFYTGEIIKGLEHLHSLNIVHRDLKPENILLDEKMHIKISDFGSAKILHPTDNSDEASNSLGFLRSSSFVGTAQYVSPEVLTEKKVCLASDLWSLGCVIYQIVSGLPPFRNESEYLIFQKIQQLNYDFPPGFFENAKDMVKKLLVLNAADRLGSKDKPGHYSHLRKHSFLSDLDLDVLYKKQPPIITTYTPESEDNEDLWKEVTEPGLEGREIELLSKMITNTTNFKPNKQKPKSPAARKVSHHLAKLHLSLDEREKLLQDQEKNNKWHKFVEGNLILRQGLLDKRKGLFPRRRMFLLTTGPHLYYVDPVNNVLKGEVPLGPTTMPEGKNFKTFFVHTPNRTYYLEDPTNSSQQWMQAIEELRDYYFPQ